MAAPSKQAITSLYHNMLKSSQSFSSYNFRNYFVKRTQDTFRQIQNETDPEKVKAMYAEAAKESTVLRRSSIVNQLYGGWKIAVEAQDPKAEAIMDRGNN